LHALHATAGHLTCAHEPWTGPHLAWISIYESFSLTSHSLVTRLCGLITHCIATSRHVRRRRTRSVRHRRRSTESAQRNVRKMWGGATSSNPRFACSDRASRHLSTAWRHATASLPSRATWPRRLRGQGRVRTIPRRIRALAAGVSAGIMRARRRLHTASSPATTDHERNQGGEREREREREHWPFGLTTGRIYGRRAVCVREFKFKSAVTLPCVRVTQLTIDNRYYNHTRPVLARTVLHVGLISGIADEPASAGIAVAVAPRPTMAASLVVIVCFEPNYRVWRQHGTLGTPTRV
jgi:hypothetical protein